MNSIAPSLIVLVGYPGVGKSTVAEVLQQRLSADVHATDVIRKEIVTGEPTYSRDESQKVYDEMFRRAKYSVRNDRCAILDATFNIQKGRNHAEEVAEELGCNLVFLWVQCPEDIVRERLAQRTNDVSDADFEIYKTVKEKFDPMDCPYTVIDNRSSKQQVELQVDNLLQGLSEIRDEQVEEISVVPTQD